MIRLIVTREGYPTIGIDCRFAETASGIGRYTRELMAALRKRSDPWNTTFLNPEISMYSLAEQIQLPSEITKAGIDLLHVPHFNVPLRCPVPFVVTIHDLILHRFPNQALLPKRHAYRALMRHAVRNAAHIIAVSHHTADDIAMHYGESVRTKISVIAEGISPQFTRATPSEIQRVRNAYHLPEDFLLYIGASKEHKNVQTLIEAINNRPLILVTRGKEVANLKLKSNVRILEEVEDTDLPALLSSASAFVTATRDEGFGLPPLEAMACGCPVVASNRGSLPEVLGDHAVLVEPTVNGMREGLKRIGEIDRTLAITHARSFSWELMAERTAQVYAQSLYG